jgi:hypothetical protein
MQRLLYTNNTAFVMNFKDVCIAANGMTIHFIPMIIINCIK